MLKELNIPRKIVTSGQDVRREIHGFCDASERAYGACIYMRSINTEGTFALNMFQISCRTVKALSLPRLELCGAQLLAQLMDKVVSTLEINIDNKYYWTDSSIVLHWLQASNRKLPVFIAHRIGDIQEITSIENWKHVGSAQNPADLVSRGISAKELVNSQL